MSDNTARLGLPEIAQMQEMTSAQINDALLQLDALCSPSVLGLFVNDPPASPADGDTYVTGGAPTGAWAGYAYKIAYCVDGGWRMFTPFDGLVVHRSDSSSFAVYLGGQWKGLGTMLAGPEVSIASGATCDLGGADGLRVLITGTTTITSFGTGANTLRLVRFAGPLTLTHDAASLILPGGVDIVTEPGDCATFASDGSGNWRCRSFARADGRMVNMASPAFTGTLTGPDGGMWGASGLAGLAGLAVQGATINASGIGLGVTPAYPVDVHASNGLLARFQGAGNSSKGILFDNTAGYESDITFADGGTWKWHIGKQSNNNFHIYSFAGGTDQLSITAAGEISLASPAGQAIKAVAGGTGGVTLASGATAWASVSDGVLKNWTPQQTDYRSAIRAIEMGDFTWKDGGRADFGAVAQKLDAALAGTPLQGVFVQKPVQADEPWRVAWDYGGRLALWGVKDLYAMIDKLAARVAALEATHAAG